MSKFTRLLGLIAVLVILVLALGVTVAQEDNVLQLNWGGPGDIPTLDPTRGSDTTSIQVILEIFPGLTLIDELTLDTRPAMSTSWDISDDGLTYTFHILPEVSWVKYNKDSGEVEQIMVDGSPRYVTAADFKYGMMRSMDPRISEYYGGILAVWVAGGSEYYRSLADVAEDAPEEEVTALVDAAAANVQINVIDDYTLELVASQPAAFLNTIFGMWMSTAQPSWIVEEFGDTWTEDSNVATYGPFALSEWKHNESLTLVRNPFWAGTEFIPVPQLDGVHGAMLATEAELANYEAGLLDVSGVPITDLDRVRSDAVLSLEYATGPSLCTYSYAFNIITPPFDDVRVRRAFSMAIDRQELIDNVIRGGQLPAQFFSYPDLTAAPHQEDYPDLAIGQDADLARELIDEYVAENGPLPPITFTMNTVQGHIDIANAVVDMWRTKLGVENVELVQQEWAVYLDATRDPNTTVPIIRYGWCQDYPDANNFLFDVWHSDTISLTLNWTSPEFDSLLEEAQREPDTQVRTELYAEAEYILTNLDAIVIPIYYYTSHRLTKPYVDRLYSRTGHTQYEFWSLNR
jgi:oligopeptide transport system substrate-binding protein